MPKTRDERIASMLAEAGLPPGSRVTVDGTPRNSRQEIRAKVGNMLLRILRREHNILCTLCFRGTVEELNRLTPDQVREQIPIYAPMLYENFATGAAERRTVQTQIIAAHPKASDPFYKQLMAQACDACEPETPPDCTDADIVVDSNRHGFGDAMLLCWVAEGAKLQGITIAHYATSKMADLVRCFGQEVVSTPTYDMRNINEAYYQEIAAHGTKPALQNRCDWLGVRKPVRPKHVEIPRVVSEWARKQVRFPPVLLFPESTRHIRTWPMNYWIVLSRQIEERGFQPIICTWNNRDTWKKYTDNVLHGLTWMETIALMKHARAVFGNNSGPVHVSGTLDVPTFVLSGLTTEKSLEGIPSMRHVAVSREVCPCVGCYYAGPPRGPVCDLGCLALQSLTPRLVMEQFDRAGIVQ